MRKTNRMMSTKRSDTKKNKTKHGKKCTEVVAHTRAITPKGGLKRKAPRLMASEATVLYRHMPMTKPRFWVSARSIMLSHRQDTPHRKGDIMKRSSRGVTWICEEASDVRPMIDDRWWKEKEPSQN